MLQSPEPLGWDRTTKLEAPMQQPYCHAGKPSRGKVTGFPRGDT